MNPKGAGIGLYASKIICEKLGGDISCFTNQNSSGTTFQFRIQLRQTNPPTVMRGVNARLRQNQSLLLNPAPLGGQGRLLVGQDASDLRPEYAAAQNQDAQIVE